MFSLCIQWFVVDELSCYVLQLARDSYEDQKKQAIDASAPQNRNTTEKTLQAEIWDWSW